MMEYETTKKIAGIKFSLWSPKEIRKYSVLEVTAPETYNEDGIPVPGGLMDSKLGVIEPGQKCGTCGNTSDRCPGHFGHIELAVPVIHIAFVKDVHKLLVSTCRNCGRLLLTQEELDEYKEKLENPPPYNPNIASNIAKEIFAKAKKVKICPHCGKPQREIEFIRPTLFYEITEDGGATRLLPSAIRERLERIPDDDLRLLGYNPEVARPEWFVLQVLPVPPVAVRPSITLESGIRSEDDLTHKLVDILRVNQRVREAKESGTPPLIVQDLIDLLQYHVTTYFDNEVSGIPQAHHRSGRPLRTLSQRLKGKEGRFRSSLSGKRVDFSSRTVISPDPCLDIDEVGVPLEVAMKLTIPERVTPYNIEFLRELVINGPFKHPGANYIIRPDGIKIRLEYASNREALAYSLGPGYVVERHLMDGDYVIFNRQPSLHRMSIMAHRVRVLKGRSFRLHPASCLPYNADFDGDEMNLHVAQGEEARSEAMLLMRVPDQIISPRYGGPIIGATRDFLTASYLLTKDGTLLTEEEFMDLAVAGGYEGELPEPVKVEGGKKYYSGKQLFSLFLPKDFNYTLTSRWMKSCGKGAAKDVVIKDGKLLKGVVDKATIGAEEPDSVLHRLVKDYGTETASKFLNSFLRVLRAYMDRYGFTYGYDELQVSDEVKKKIAKVIDDAYKRVDELIREYKEGTLPLIRGYSPEEALEYYIMEALSKARDEAGKIADSSLPEDNSGVIMARTGARGSTLNIGQMVSCVGQQAIRGKRIVRGYMGRALTHFKRYDPSPDARGFVRSNYRDGLNPVEFFFHSMAGREGLVDTAVRTQQSGYMQRRLINAMEHLKVEYDLTVRDPDGNIIQFVYGEDGVDPSKSDQGKAVNVLKLAERIALKDKGPKLKEEELKGLLARYGKKLNKKLFEELERALKEVPLSRKGAKELCERTVELLEKARVEPGLACGVVAAQSMGEPGTQMTLRTFHFAGVKERDVTLGLPRLIELVDARKQISTPSMDIYLKNGKSKEEALRIARKILFTKLADLVEYSEVDVMGRIKFILDGRKLEERGYTIEDVERVLKGGKRKVEVDRESGTVYVTVGEADMATLNQLREKLLRSRIGGIPGIARVTVVKQGDEWMIQTAGSNLQKVMQVEGVDPYRTTTNSVYEIYLTLGIEAARNALVKEIYGTLQEQGLEVDIRHIYLLADLMTSKGLIQQVGRHGVTGSKHSVLARAAFEITVPTLASAAVSGEVDWLKGVTESVIVGLPIPVGTGMVDIFMKKEV